MSDVSPSAPAPSSDSSEHGSRPPNERPGDANCPPPSEPLAADNPLSDSFYEILNITRAAATKSRQYNSNATRTAISTKFEKCEGKTAYSWQLDVSEAIVLGLDSIVIAGTGAGKTMPFMMPLLADETNKKMVIIVSPLTALEQDMADRFNKMGMPATAVYADAYTDQMHKDIVARKYRIILASPEMLLEHPRFSKLMRTQDFTADVTCVVVDEVHCVSQWGENFRKSFQDLGKLRSYVPISVPFLATSATLPPHILLEIQHHLCFSMPKTFFVNLGNDRPNITALLCRMRGAAKDLAALDFLVDEVSLGLELLQTLVFVNTRTLAHKACNHLRALLPEDMRDQVDFLHAGRRSEANRDVLKRFKAGEIKILCATEAAGMGMDIANIFRVVQFMLPPSLSVWIQRLGRAGRNGGPAIVILLVEPSAFQTRRAKQPECKKATQYTKKRKKNEPDDESDDTDAVLEDSDANFSDEDSDGEGGSSTVGSRHIQYAKKVEEGLRQWIEAKTCRRLVADRYFNNPPRYKALQVPCCDLCVLEKLKSGGEDQLTDPEHEVLKLLNRISSREPPSSTDPTDVPPETTPESEATSGKPKRVGDRKEGWYQDCRDKLRTWRQDCWNRSYADCIFTVQSLLSDSDLEKLAKHARIKTMEDINTELADWDFRDDYGDEVLALLAPIDEARRAARKTEIENDRAKRQKQSQAKAKQREEERREMKHREALARKALKDAEKAARSVPSGPIASTSATVPLFAPYPTYPIPPPSPVYTTYVPKQASLVQLSSSVPRSQQSFVFVPPQPFVVSQPAPCLPTDPPASTDIPATIPYPRFSWNYYVPKTEPSDVP